MKTWKNVIDDLKNDNVALSYTLSEIIDLAEKYGKNEIADYAILELNGYAGKTEILPSYRKLPSEVIVDYATPFGSMMNNIPLDMSSLGEDVTNLFFTNGITEIEALNRAMSADSDSCDSPLHPGQFKMLKDLIAQTSPGIKLLRARYRFPKGLIFVLLQRVRMNLVLKIQSISIEEPVVIHPLDSFANLQNQAKSVFVSYAWDSGEHTDMVVSFVNFLREKGYNATMDRKETQEVSAIDLNQMMVDGIKNNDKVVVVLSRAYKKKADDNKGGVGNEFAMIFSDIKINPKKYVFVSFEPLNNDVIAAILPFAIPSREIIDLKQDQDKHNFNQLFAKLDEQNLIDFSDVGSEKQNVVHERPKPFKL